MKITLEDVKYMAQLSKLSFDDEGAEQLRSEFEAILDHFENLDQEDLSGIEPYDFTNATSVLRADESRVFEDKAALFKNARDLRDGAIEIPKVIE